MSSDVQYVLVGDIYVKDGDSDLLVVKEFYFTFVLEDAFRVYS